MKQTQDQKYKEDRIQMSKAILISYKTRQRIKMDIKYKSKDNTPKTLKETL